MAQEARTLHKAEVAACRKLGALGAELVPDGATILTHCNAGALATGGYGTALGIVRAAKEAGKQIRVIACETRPYLQGARLTAWELNKDAIAVEVITDSMAAHFMAKRAVTIVVVGADRVAASGDVANKVGTYQLALAAQASEVPFVAAGPSSSVDLSLPTGDAIEIEERDGAEVRGALPEDVPCRNPAFDVTPAELVWALVTEQGVARPVSTETVGQVSASERSR